MPKVLIFGATPAQGGIETFVLNVCKVMQGLADIYLYNFSGKPLAYNDVFIKKYHVKILDIVTPNSLLGHFTRKAQYKKFFKEHQFDIVHINANSPSNYDFAEAALKAGAKVIYHSHNDSAESFSIGTKHRKLISKVRSAQKKRLSGLDIKRVAVSNNAAKWMFGDNQEVQIIPNGVDFERVGFSHEKRMQGRAKLHISDSDTVLLVASRLTKQKNVGKSLSIAKLAIESDLAQHLIIVGDGEERALINATLNTYPQKIQQRIHVLGAQTDMQLWYSVSDILLMPSLYEGLPYSVLEAQANGLSILASKAIPQQAVIVKNLIHFENIQNTDDIWVKNIQLFGNKVERKEYLQVAMRSKYSIENFKNIIGDIYGSV